MPSSGASRVLRSVRQDADAVAEFAGVGIGLLRREVDGEKANARQAAAIEQLGQCTSVSPVSVDPGRAEEFKGCVRTAADGDVGGVEESERGVERGFFKVTQVGRWVDPVRLVESNQSPRCQPRMATTVSGALRLRC